jgi:hypothetical protein
MKKIKKHCVSCGAELPGTKEYYKNHGNYCLLCNGIASGYSKMSGRGRNARGIYVRRKLESGDPEALSEGDFVNLPW